MGTIQKYSSLLAISVAIILSIITSLGSERGTMCGSVLFLNALVFFGALFSLQFKRRRMLVSAIGISAAIGCRAFCDSAEVASIGLFIMSAVAPIFAIPKIIFLIPEEFQFPRKGGIVEQYRVMQGELQFPDDGV